MSLCRVQLGRLRRGRARFRRARQDTTVDHSNRRFSARSDRVEGRTPARRRRSVGSRVEHRPGDVDRTSKPAQQAGREQTSTQCECSDLAGMVSRIRGDAAAALSRSLSPGTFLRGKVTVVVGCQQHPRIADQPFHPRCNIEYPQRIHRVRTTGAAQKDHAFTIG